jgi:hypothetical protein
MVDEPIAYINVEERKLEWATPIKWETPTVVKMDKVPLYTAPQKYAPSEDNAAYERGFIDGMQKQMQSSVDKAVNKMTKREWVGLTDEEILAIYDACDDWEWHVYERMLEAKLKEKNGG